MRVVVEAQEIGQLIQLLRAEGRTVIAPTLSDGAIAPAEIESVEDLPAGWTDVQTPGRYQLEKSHSGEWFASSSPSDSWKRFLFPPEVLMVRSTRTNGDDLTIERPDLPQPRLAFFGIRSCDLAAIAALDRVFSTPDPTYETRRHDLFVVAVACAHPGGTCFCASMGTGPTPNAGFDLALNEFWSQDRHEYLVTVGTEKGMEIISRIPRRNAGADDDQRASRQHQHAVQNMGRRLEPDIPKRAAVALDHSHWEEVGERCLACGNCTMVCPTCFCNKMIDRADLAGTSGERWRVWDSCFSADFSALHGMPVRSSIGDRYRHWLLHKLVTWQEQFGMPGCVGCGRCITACPVGIDLTVEVEEVAAR